MLPAVRRAVSALEPALDSVEELTPADRVQDPDPSRVLDLLHRPELIQPTQDLKSPAHLKAGRFQGRFLSVYDRRMELVWDTAPNRALRHVLLAAARRLGQEGGREARTLRSHYASLAGHDGMSGVGPMRATDLLHRSLRAARYRCVLKLHRLLTATQYG